MSIHCVLLGEAKWQFLLLQRKTGALLRGEENWGFLGEEIMGAKRKLVAKGR